MSAQEVGVSGMQGSALSIPLASGHGRAGRPHDVSNPDLKKNTTRYPHLIVVIKVTGRDTSVEIPLSSQRAGFDHVVSKCKSWHEKDHF